ncbi:MAG: lamin tail domain-containing protein [Bacteroidetes bacterium]|nr:lamin tail domain-containing protein [Bacteroidota bacterium]
MKYYNKMTSRICLIFILILLFVAHEPVMAQLYDDFFDGDFTENPFWSGDSQDFTVNLESQLQLNTSGSGTSFLSVPFTFDSIMEWDFWVKLQFSPSSNNFARVYLAADQINLEAPLNGYFLQLGEAGSDDAIELFRQTGSSVVSICTGTGGLIAGPSSISYKIRKFINDEWEIYIKPEGTWTYTIDASGMDTIVGDFSYFGFLCNYTSSNSTRFFFDDVYAGPFITDTVPPEITSVKVLSENQLSLFFSEPVDEITAETNINYFLSGGIGNPITTVRDNQVPAMVVLTFNDTFESGITYELFVTDLTDIEGNSIIPVTLTFTFIKPGAFDVVINEIMANPAPAVDLPEDEYIELHNRLPYPVDLSGWELEYGSSHAIFPEVSLLPDSFLMVTKDNALSAYGQNVSLFSSTSSLNNSGTTITLKNLAGQVIHSVTYTEEWYKEDFKRNGGWSLEQIDPLNPCCETGNWIASIDASGGTPGRSNSVLASNPDTTHPAIYGLSILDSRNIIITFNEKMDSLTLLNPLGYFIDGDIGYPVNLNPVPPDYRAVRLEFSKELNKNTPYLLYLKDTLTDCLGNAVTFNTSRKIGLPGTAGHMDVVINEILTDQKDDGADFIEIYNRSNQIIDLYDLALASYDTMTSAITSAEPLVGQSFLMFPEDYLVLTVDPEKVKADYLTTNPDGFIKMSSFPGYNEDHGIVVLSGKNDNRIIDKFTYSSDYHFSLLNSTEGVSLERVNYDRPTEDRTNWHSASENAGFATPAYKNSQFSTYLKPENPVKVYPEIFSPDNDGFNDILNISYKLNEPGYAASISIYDSNGRLVRHLANNRLIGSEGVLSWDGLNDTGERVLVGIYVVLVEVFNLQGTVQRYKECCVVGGRL